MCSAHPHSSPAGEEGSLTVLQVDIRTGELRKFLKLAPTHLVLP